MKMPGGAGEVHCALLYGGAEASTTGSAEPVPAVIDAPLNVAVAPPELFNVSVDSNALLWVEAATVVTHGDRWSAVLAPGPALPAEAATNTPAWYASRNASSTGSPNGSEPPEIEKLITLTPSRMACCTAAAESEL